MAPRTSAQARGAARKQAYPPSKQSSDSQSRSPEARRTRYARSASRDLDASDAEGPGYTRVRRSTRQASVDSEASVADSVNESSRLDNRQSRSSRVQESADLSVVNEDVESDRDGEGEERRNGSEDADSEDVADEDIDQELEAQLLQSSTGALQSPQLSQDSDIGYDSDGTTRSEEESRGLEPELVLQFLPDLLASSCKILDQVAPSGISFEEVESIVTELKTPTSLRAIRFKRDEQAFGNDRQFYGTDPYINPSHIYKALFGNKAKEISKSGLDLGPDPILHAANLATLVKDIFITARDDPQMRNKLLRVDPLFPEPFLKGFHQDAKLGNSNLEDMTFELSLEIRTQCVITALLTDETDLDPEQTLLSLFFHKYTARQTSPQMSYFDEILERGQLLEIMRNVSTSKEQDDVIRSRVKEIQLAFQLTDDGIMVDYEQLGNMFPWSGFLEQLAVWSRKRLREIKRDVVPPEGVDNIIQSLHKAMKADNPEPEPVDSPSPQVLPRQQTLPRTITPGNTGQSLYSNAQNVLLLEQLKRQMSMDKDATSKVSNSVQHSTQTVNRASSAAQNVLLLEQLKRQMSMDKDATSKVSNSAQHSTQTVNRASPAAHVQPTIDDPERVVRPSQDYVDVADKYTRESNKENRPSNEHQQGRGSKQSVSGRQTSATQNSFASPSNKRPRPDIEEELEDDDFQEDSRLPDPRRRKTAPVPTYRRPVQREPSPPEMIRYDPSDDRVAQAQRQRRETSNIPLHRSTVTDVGDEAEEEEENVDDDASSVPPPSFQAVSIAARHAVMQTTERPIQKRTFWTGTDEDRLVRLIEEHGTSWSVIAKLGGFQTFRDQVALKDKARNMKVAYLKSGVPLPANFERVALGAKEVATVQRVHPEWRP